MDSAVVAVYGTNGGIFKKKKAKTNKQKMPLQVSMLEKNISAFTPDELWQVEHATEMWASLNPHSAFDIDFAKSFKLFIRGINPLFWKCSTQTSWLQTIKMSFFRPLMSSFVISNVLD